MTRKSPGSRFRTSTLTASALAGLVMFTLDVPTMRISAAAAAEQTIPVEAAVPAAAAPAQLADYARREQAAPAELANFKGGSPVIIGTTAAVVILCVVLLIIIL